MNVWKCFIGLLLSALSGTTAFAQLQQREIIIQPVAKSARLPKLNDLVKAKLVDDGEHHRLVVMAEAYRTEKRPVQITRDRQEIRTRNVPNAAGEVVEQKYTVTVSETVAGERQVRIDAGIKPVAIPIEDCQFFDLEGQALEVATVAESLRTLKTIFLQENCQGELPTIPAAFRDVLKPDCVLVLTHRIVRKVLP